VNNKVNNRFTKCLSNFILYSIIAVDIVYFGLLDKEH